MTWSWKDSVNPNWKQKSSVLETEDSTQILKVKPVDGLALLQKKTATRGIL